jgi:hypothetical protein
MSERIREIESECCNNRFVQRYAEERTYVIKKNLHENVRHHYLITYLFIACKIGKSSLKKN